MADLVLWYENSTKLLMLKWLDGNTPYLSEHLYIYTDKIRRYGCGLTTPDARLSGVVSRYVRDEFLCRTYAHARISLVVCMDCNPKAKP